MFFSSMNPIKHFGLPLMAASVVVGGFMMEAPAQALELVNKYSVTTAYKDQYYGGGAGHTIYGLDAGSLNERSSITTSSEDLFWEEYDDGTVHFYGTVYDKKQVNGGNASPFGWEVDVHLVKRDGAGTGGPKKELNRNNPYGSGVVDPSTWSFYDFSDNVASTLTGFGGEIDNLVLTIDDLTGGKYPVQVGIGANGKNSNLGMSTWFKAYDENGNLYENHADFNVDLTPVPTPAAGLAWLFTGGAAIARKRKQERDNES